MGPSAQDFWPPELDALAAAPAHHTLLFENETVRVLDTRIPPGGRTPVHTHRWPAVLHVTAWSTFIRRDAVGAVILDSSTQPQPRAVPFTLWSPALAPHSLENTGATEIRVLSVEIKHAP